MEAAVERHQPPETAVERLARQSAALATAFSRMVMLSMMLTPVLLIAILTVDIPVHLFDRFAGEAVASRPSNWLSRGGVIMALAPMLVILFARKYGGDEACRAVTASWGLAAIAVFAELSYLAPSLEDGDLPSVRFTVVFTGSAMAAQYVTASIYDVVRGGGRWWRAPLYAALCSYFTHAFLYFPGVYMGTGAPWLNWFIGDFAIKTLLALAFLPVYGLLRKKLKPKGGFGGR